VSFEEARGSRGEFDITLYYRPQLKFLLHTGNTLQRIRNVVLVT
jgi:hypothetical protein